MKSRYVVFAAVALCAAQVFAVEHTEVTKAARIPFLRGMGFDGYYGGRNGTFMTDKRLEMLEKSRNIVPVISIEGGRKETDSRRGKGVYDFVMETMERFRENGIIYGVSVTVTKENRDELSLRDMNWPTP